MLKVAYLGTFFSMAAIAWASQSPATSPLADAALARTQVVVSYNGAYQRIDYPNGDVADNLGVCTDLVIRALRTQTVDLQQLVHEDMVRNFTAYPNHWGLHKPDPNIDHRRVPNLETFFARHGKRLPASKDAQDYQPGDIVSWRLASGLPHIGIVANAKVANSERHYIIHNIGQGPKQEDVLFNYQLVGHYRYPQPNDALER